VLVSYSATGEYVRDIGISSGSHNVSTESVGHIAWVMPSWDSRGRTVLSGFTVLANAFRDETKEVHSSLLGVFFFCFYLLPFSGNQSCVRFATLLCMKKEKKN